MYPERLLALAALLALAPPAAGQIHGAAADRKSAPSTSLALHFERFGFLELDGLTLRGTFPLTRRVTPFLEITLGHFRPDGVGRELLEGTETAAMAGAGAKYFLLGERALGRPFSVSGYLRLQVGLLDNVDLFASQALLLGTYDFTDHKPLLLHLGGGLAYRNARFEAEDTRLRDEHTRGRFFLAVEVPLGRRFSALAEYGYEDRSSGGLAVRYLF